MHSVQIFEWDNKPLIHGILIVVNLLLLASLIIRFEWPLIKKRFKSSDENHIGNNIKHNENPTTNGLYPHPHRIPHRISPNAKPLKRKENGMILYRDRVGMPKKPKINQIKKASVPLSVLPDGSQISGIDSIELTNLNYKKNNIEEEKYGKYDTDETKSMDKVNKNIANNVQNLSKASSYNRRRASITFYRELFNVDNFDNHGKLLTANKRKKRRNKINKLKRKRASYRNDSLNLREHQRSSVDTENNENQIHIDVDVEVDMEYKENSKDINYNLNIAQLLTSKIYDGEDKASVRSRYRYILYLPVIVFVLRGMITLILGASGHGLSAGADYITYGYPIFSIILSLVLWCEIDIVILSCGGAHIVEECLEVQISANGHEYKCIYCCWCDLSVLRLCNCCTMDNGFSLFKCHHKFMKILICLICPLLTVVLFIISEFPQIHKPLIMTKIGDINDAKWLEMNLNNSSVYWLIFIIICALYLILMFTATYIGILIVKSLHFVSSLNPKTLTMQYVTSIILTFIMQIQFVILLFYFNVYIIDDTDDDVHGLRTATPFYMILVYIEFIIASIWNHFSFRNIDFNRFGREAIEKNEVQLFDFQPDFDGIHDLHNYRRVYGEKFLWNLDHKNHPFLHNNNSNNNNNNDNDNDNQQQQQINNISNDSNPNHKQSKTPIITSNGLISAKKPPSKKPKKNAIKKQKSRSKEKALTLSPIKDETNSLTQTQTQTTHSMAYPHTTTTTTSLSLDLNSDAIYSLDEDTSSISSSSSSSSSWNNHDVQSDGSSPWDDEPKKSKKPPKSKKQNHYKHKSKKSNKNSSKIKEKYKTNNPPNTSKMQRMDSEIP